ncbi:hypothetical protein [Nocardiopsis alkaliphila]|uniref:hypothetical protein n=1 Tax=Nocardiopsis alkaliphila TaxID=225762 RepID=UPI00034B2F3E|nr:hypothetical protein [Nocardiopsis alkaliphila]
MNTKTKPGSVIAVLVLLILIATYQLVYGLFGLLGAVLIEGSDLRNRLPAEFAAEAEAAQNLVWAVYLGAGLALVYGLVSIVLAVMVGKDHPRARGATIVVNAIAGVALLALMFTAVYGLGAIISALFAFTVVALLYNGSSRRHYAVAIGAHAST